MQRLDVATNIPSLSLLSSILGDQVRKVILLLERRRDASATRVLERVTLDSVGDRGTGESLGVLRVGAVRSKVDLDDLLGVAAGAKSGRLSAAARSKEHPCGGVETHESTTQLKSRA